MIVRFVTTRMIRGYQRWISPYKGFRCAHHVMHGDGTCSQYGLEAFESYGFIEAWRHLRQRFLECREANAVYQIMSEEERRKRRQQPEQSNNSSSDGCDCDNLFAPLMALEIADCTTSACDAGAFNACDFGACDLGGCDVGGCF